MGKSLKSNMFEASCGKEIFLVFPHTRNFLKSGQLSNILLSWSVAEFEEADLLVSFAVWCNRIVLEWTTTFRSQSFFFFFACLLQMLPFPPHSTIASVQKCGEWFMCCYSYDLFERAFQMHKRAWNAFLYYKIINPGIKKRQISSAGGAGAAGFFPSPPPNLLFAFKSSFLLLFLFSTHGYNAYQTGRDCFLMKEREKSHLRNFNAY